MGKTYRKNIEDFRYEDGFDRQRPKRARKKRAEMKPDYAFQEQRKKKFQDQFKHIEDEIE